MNLEQKILEAQASRQTRLEGDQVRTHPNSPASAFARNAAATRPLLWPIVKSFIKRLLVSAIVTVAAIVFLVVGALGRGHSELVFLVAEFSVIFAVGWTLLPIFQASRMLRIALTAAWLAFGVLLFVAPHDSGLLFFSWFSATVVLLPSMNPLRDQPSGEGQEPGLRAD